MGWWVDIGNGGMVLLLLLWFQAVHERDVQIRQLHQECEEVRSEHQTKSITASDMEREINRLKKVSSIVIQHETSIILEMSNTELSPVPYTKVSLIHTP